MLLIHPGLAEPDRLQAHAGADMDPESLSSASDSVEAVDGIVKLRHAINVEG